MGKFGVPVQDMTLCAVIPRSSRLTRFALPLVYGEKKLSTKVLILYSACSRKYIYEVKEHGDRGSDEKYTVQYVGFVDPGNQIPRSDWSA